MTFEKRNTIDDYVILSGEETVDHEKIYITAVTYFKPDFSNTTLLLTSNTYPTEAEATQGHYDTCLDVIKNPLKYHNLGGY